MRQCECSHWKRNPPEFPAWNVWGGASNDRENKKVVCTPGKVSTKLQRSTSAIQALALRAHFCG